MSTCLSVGILLCLLATLVTGQSCGRKLVRDDSGSSRIAGGSSSLRGEWPWQAIVYSTRLLTNTFCGGTILSEDWVMTAAICFDSTDTISVYVGKLYSSRTITETGQQQLSVSATHKHPQFTNTASGNDVGLLRLSTKIIFNDNIQPVCLPPGTNYNVPAGTRCYVSGWGHTSSSSSDLTFTLRDADLRVQSESYCSSRHSSPYPQTVMCALESGTSICRGDGGGPLVCETDNGWYQYGITSRFAIPCGTGPSFFTEITEIYSWIQATTGLSFPAPIADTTTTTTTTTTTAVSTTTSTSGQSCGRKVVRDDSGSSRIAGGSSSLRGEWPWQAIVYSEKLLTTSFCGGTILSEDWVMTAAHCFDSTDTITVYVGKLFSSRTFTEAGQQLLSVRTTHKHPQFTTAASGNDVGLLRLSSKITFNDNIQPVCLPPGTNYNVPAGTRCYVSGWGHTSSSSSVLAFTLRDADLRVQSESYCLSIHGSPYPQSVMCALETGTSLCSGDSGGPLVCERDNGWYQYGIASRSVVPCGTGPDFFAEITEVYSWIEATTGLSFPAPVADTTTTTTTTAVSTTTTSGQSSANCGRKVVRDDSGSSKIAGGSLSQRGEWPWQAMVYSEKLLTYTFCGGTVLSEDWVMTAAQCFDSTDTISVYVGKLYSSRTIIEAGQQLLSVSTTHKHPQFTNTASGYDVGLLRLSSKITFNDNIQPVCLPPGTNYNVPANTRCYVSGWGHTSSSSSDLASSLRDADLRVQSESYCSNNHGSPYPQTVMCALESGTSTCEGDGGGPLVCERDNGWYQYGINSRSAIPCGTGPDYFTEITEVYSWIQATTGLSFPAPVDASTTTTSGAPSYRRCGVILGTLKLVAMALFHVY